MIPRCFAKSALQSIYLPSYLPNTALAGCSHSCSCMPHGNPDSSGGMLQQLTLVSCPNMNPSNLSEGGKHVDKTTYTVAISISNNTCIYIIIYIGLIWLGWKPAYVQHMHFQLVHAKHLVNVMSAQEWGQGWAWPHGPRKASQCSRMRETEYHCASKTVWRFDSYRDRSLLEPVNVPWILKNTHEWSWRYYVI